MPGGVAAGFLLRVTKPPMKPPIPTKPIKKLVPHATLRIIERLSPFSRRRAVIDELEPTYTIAIASAR